MSNFSFSHNVFKRLVLQTHKNRGLFEKQLTLYRMTGILALSKMKAFADNKSNVTISENFVFYRVENIVKTGENPGNHYMYFLLFPQCFQKAFSTGTLNVAFIWYRTLNNSTYSPPTAAENTILLNLFPHNDTF